MLRAEITPASFHARQADYLPGKFGLVGPNERKLALFRCTQMILS